MRSLGRGSLKIAFVLGIFSARGAWAQDGAGVPKKDLESRPRRFFEHPIDYWDRGLTIDGEKVEASKEGVREKPAVPGKSPERDWGQMVRQPDGTLAFYELPGPLVELLEDPSAKNIQAYLHWKLTRAKKILRAAQALKEYRNGPEGGPGAAPDPEKGKGEPAPPAPERAAPETGRPAPRAKSERTPFTILYFHRTGCAPCDTQDRILAQWLGEKTEGKLVAVPFGEHPELWQKYRVRGTPSLVIQAQDSTKPVFLEGVAREGDLAQALEESRLAPKGGRGKERKE